MPAWDSWRMTTTTKSLELQIERAVEQVVREHLAACETAAAVAVRTAFERATKPTKPSRPTKRPSSPRRSRAELEALEEQLYEAILRHPGETMAVLAPAVGATAQELNRPARGLRRQGRVRSLGQRQYTRYFPMGS